MNASRSAGCFLAGALLSGVAAATDIGFTGTANPACFTEGAEGTVTVKATNTLGHTTDALVMAACAAFESTAERPTWIVEKTIQNANDPLKLPTVFLYEFNNQNCIRAQPSAPGGFWPAGTNETVTFTYDVPDTVAASTLVLHDTAWSQEAPKDKEIKLAECGAPPQKPKLAIAKELVDVEGNPLQYKIRVQNVGSAKTAAAVRVEDLIPNKLLVTSAFWGRSHHSGSGSIPVSGQKITMVFDGTHETGGPFLPKEFAVIYVRVEPKEGQSGEISNSATVCGGGDPDAPCLNPLRSNVVKTTLPNPIGPPPLSPFFECDTAFPPAGTPVVCQETLALRAGSQATAGTTAYAWVLSDELQAPAATGSRLVHTFAAPGKRTVSLVAFANGRRSTTTKEIQVKTVPPGCTANATTLCLLGNRFKVQADWQALNNASNGAANTGPLTSDTGAFWFFDPANLELIVKVVDGRGLNGKFWVFFGALSDVQYQIKVTDTQTGQTREYINDQGDLTSLADTSAFPTAAASTATEELEGDAAYHTLVDDTLAADVEEDIVNIYSAACLADPNTKKLCLSDRFDVSVACTVSGGGSCTPTPVKLTSDTGYFWFFNSANIELMTKVVDGRGLNGKFWFFYGALSDVQYKIRLTDRVTGKFKEYTNPQGNLASAADTAALTP